MAPRIRAEDPVLPEGNRECLLLKLEGSDIRHLHFICSFRVIKGAVDIFGAVYTPALTYSTFVIPSWTGSLCMRVASLTPSICSIVGADEMCPECNAYCGGKGEGKGESLLCNQIKSFNQIQPTSGSIIAFRDVSTAFGRVRTREMVGLKSAFTHSMIDDIPTW